MPLTVSCSFCGKNIEPGTGLMFVRNDNQRFYFCSRKCERNMIHLGRRARYLKWTSSYERGPTPPRPEKPPEEPEETVPEGAAEEEGKPKRTARRGRKKPEKKPKEPPEEEPEPEEEEPEEDSGERTEEG